MARRPRLTPEDEALWSRVADSVRPLKRRRAPEARPEKKEESAAEPRAAAKKQARATAPPQPPRTLEPLAAPRKEPRPLDPSKLADIDRRNAERLRRGQMPIDGVLDLHGHRQHEAEESLIRFLASAQAAGKRCILVITGKGQIGGERGVLRRKLGEWLNQSPNRTRVLAFAQAQPKHGGAGAFYVLLKRRRDS